MRCVGGEVGATSSLAPKIGPLGLVSFYLLYIYISRLTTNLNSIYINVWINDFMNQMQYCLLQ